MSLSPDPQWLIYRSRQDTQSDDQHILTETQAERIATAIDFTMGVDPTDPDALIHVVNNANRMMYNALERQLQEAERQAAKISSLRERLSQLTIESNEQEQQCMPYL